MFKWVSLKHIEQIKSQEDEDQKGTMSWFFNHLAVELNFFIRT